MSCFLVPVDFLLLASPHRQRLILVDLLVLNARHMKVIVLRDVFLLDSFDLDVLIAIAIDPANEQFHVAPNLLDVVAMHLEMLVAINHLALITRL